MESTSAIFVDYHCTVTEKKNHHFTQHTRSVETDNRRTDKNNTRALVRTGGGRAADWRGRRRGRTRGDSRRGGDPGLRDEAPCYPREVVSRLSVPVQTPLQTARTRRHQQREATKSSGGVPKGQARTPASLHVNKVNRPSSPGERRWPTIWRLSSMK